MRCAVGLPNVHPQLVHGPRGLTGNSGLPGPFGVLPGGASAPRLGKDPKSPEEAPGVGPLGMRKVLGKIDPATHPMPEAGLGQPTKTSFWPLLFLEGSWKTLPSLLTFWVFHLVCGSWRWLPGWRGAGPVLGGGPGGPSPPWSSLTGEQGGEHAAGCGAVLWARRRTLEKRAWASPTWGVMIFRKPSAFSVRQKLRARNALDHHCFSRRMLNWFGAEKGRSWSN